MSLVASSLFQQKPPGYFAAAAHMKDKTVEIFQRPGWLAKAEGLIALVGTIIVTAVNIPTAFLKGARMSSFNNLLYRGVIRVIDGKAALKAYSIRRAMSELRDTLFKEERSKLTRLIREGNTLFSEASPSSIAYSVARIKRELGEFGNVPDEMIQEFLEGICTSNATNIQRDLDEIDGIISDPQKLHQYAEQYRQIITLNAQKYNKLQAEMSDLEQDIQALEQELPQVAGERKSEAKALAQRTLPNDAADRAQRVQKLVQNEEDIPQKIADLRAKKAKLNREMRKLIPSEKDLKALQYWLGISQTKHFTAAVKQQLAKRKAFLESFQNGKIEMVTSFDQPTSWKKSIGKLALAGLVYYYYQTYGFSTNGLYDFGNWTIATWKNLPEFATIKNTTTATASYLWTNAKWENLSWQNAKNVGSTALNWLSVVITDRLSCVLASPCSICSRPWKYLKLKEICVPNQTFFNDPVLCLAMRAKGIWNLVTWQNMKSAGWTILHVRGISSLLSFLPKVPSHLLKLVRG